MNIFITGIAGMIGYQTAKALTAQGHTVTGIDNFNDYYEVSLKRDRASLLKANSGIDIIEADICNADYHTLLKDIDVVVHLAAYANPRHAMEFPEFYIDTNITGTQRLIKAVETMGIQNVVYASSSCVMHGQPLPWNETDRPEHANNPYGWSKYVNECQFMYSNIPHTAGLRFFTVYGPYGRPDMALFGFTKNIIAGESIGLYNFGDMKRDWTYVEDIVQGVGLVANDLASRTTTSHEVYNIGYGEQVDIKDFVAEIERCVGKKATIELWPRHPADVPATWSDTTKIKKLGYNPQTSVMTGVEKFVNWYRDYYKV